MLCWSVVVHSSSKVWKKAGCMFELRSPCLVLTESELKQTLGTAKLPRNMLSIPKIMVPVVPKGTDGIAGEMLYEKAQGAKLTHSVGIVDVKV